MLPCSRGSTWLFTRRRGIYYNENGGEENGGENGGDSMAAPTAARPSPSAQPRQHIFKQFHHNRQYISKRGESSISKRRMYYCNSIIALFAAASLAQPTVVRFVFAWCLPRIGSVCGVKYLLARLALPMVPRNQ